MTGGAAAGVQGEEQWRQDADFEGFCAPGGDFRGRAGARLQNSAIHLTEEVKNSLGSGLQIKSGQDQKEKA